MQALKDVTLAIPAGMYGLLGPNGAGKSTLMRTPHSRSRTSAPFHLGDLDVVQQKTTDDLAWLDRMEIGAPDGSSSRKALIASCAGRRGADGRISGVRNTMTPGECQRGSSLRVTAFNRIGWMLRANENG